MLVCPLIAAVSLGSFSLQGSGRFWRFATAVFNRCQLAQGNAHPCWRSRAPNTLTKVAEACAVAGSRRLCRTSKDHHDVRLAFRRCFQPWTTGVHSKKGGGATLHSNQRCAAAQWIHTSTLPHFLPELHVVDLDRRSVTGHHDHYYLFIRLSYVWASLKSKI